MTTPVAAHWAILDSHFEYHARLVNHFRGVGPDAVVRMWHSQTSGDKKCLTQFERDALKERYCELFGTWPN